jgi:hypothetical protein
MPIVGTLPYNIQNGDSVDAIPVMADFNFIVAQINANAPVVTNITPTGFTPGLAFGGASVGLVYDTQLGQYSRIGNVVWYWIYIIINAIGSSTGVATITGLPLGASAFMPGLSGVVPTGPTLVTGITFADSISHGVIHGTTTIGLYNITSNGSAVQMTKGSNFTGGAAMSVAVSGQYFV